MDTAQYKVINVLKTLWRVCVCVILELICMVLWLELYRWQHNVLVWADKITHQVKILSYNQAWGPEFYFWCLRGRRRESISELSFDIHTLMQVVAGGHTHNIYIYINVENVFHVLLNAGFKFYFVLYYKS